MLKSKSATIAVIALLVLGYLYWHGANPSNQELPNIPKQTPRQKEDDVKVWFKATFDKQRGVTLRWQVGPTAAGAQAGKPVYSSPWTNASSPIIAKRGDSISFEVLSFEGTMSEAVKTCEVFVDGVSRDGPWHGTGANPLTCETVA